VGTVLALGRELDGALGDLAEDSKVELGLGDLVGGRREEVLQRLRERDPGRGHNVIHHLRDFIVFHKEHSCHETLPLH
jgi:hypothetical protein